MLKKNSVPEEVWTIYFYYMSEKAHYSQLPTSHLVYNGNCQL